MQILFWNFLLHIDSDYEYFLCVAHMLVLVLSQSQRQRVRSLPLKPKTTKLDKWKWLRAEAKQKKDMKNFANRRKTGKKKHPNISYIKLREFWLSSHLPHCFNLVQDRICTARVKWSRVKDSDHFCSSPQPRGINILKSAVNIRSKFGGTTTRHWIIWITKTGSGGECLRVSQAVNKRKLSVTHASGQSHKSTPNS